MNLVISESGMHVTTEFWFVTLQVFHIEGTLPFDLYIVTRGFLTVQKTELFYFAPVAEHAFSYWILFFSKNVR